MRPTSITAALAEAHCEDLRREAEQAALAAEVAPAPAATGPGSAALLLASDLLLVAGHRLRARLARPPLAAVHTNAQHKPMCPVAPACQRVACLEV
jgi:hypothetical protein